MAHDRQEQMPCQFSITKTFHYDRRNALQMNLFVSVNTLDIPAVVIMLNNKKPGMHMLRVNGTHIIIYVNLVVS
jgi:hypothetical protein